ncbi:MAG: hypothetical protein SGPRY_012595 [Prymnesium sp.]
MQALACSSRFGVGACVGGFVDDGLRRLETGDVRRGKSAPMVQGTILDNLDAITAPLLMLHGASDKVAPPSHSRVVYHHLHARSVPAQLVVYPEEGHRLTSLHARRDAMQRISLGVLATKSAAWLHIDLRWDLKERRVLVWGVLSLDMAFVRKAFSSEYILQLYCDGMVWILGRH